jgi:hypothetical protein
MTFRKGTFWPLPEANETNAATIATARCLGPGPSLVPILSKDVPRKAHFFTKFNQFVVTVKGAVLPGP